MVKNGKKLTKNSQKRFKMVTKRLKTDNTVKNGPNGENVRSQTVNIGQYGQKKLIRSKKVNTVKNIQNGQKRSKYSKTVKFF